MKKQLFFNWSSGKDSALALHHLLLDRQYNVGQLLVSMNAHYNRVTMHGIRRTLLTQQLQAIAIPYTTVELPQHPTHEIYQQLMRTEISHLQNAGYGYAGFGDIFLEDLRQYREKQLAEIGIQAVFPLWRQDTRQLMHYFIESGFKAITVCVDDTLLGDQFLGREFDHNFLNELPEGVDPCGENGEFHTFCYDAPFFSMPVPFSKGVQQLEIYQYNGQQSSYRFLDLLPL